MSADPLTARDAVLDALAYWKDGADAVLLALGIPADADRREVAAAVAFARMAREHGCIVETSSPNLGTKRWKHPAGLPPHHAPLGRIAEHVNADWDNREPAPVGREEWATR